MSLDKRLKQFWAECPSCKEQSQFKYIGRQEVFTSDTGKDYLLFYNCGKCLSTRAYQSVLEHNKYIIRR